MTETSGTDRPRVVVAGHICLDLIPTFSGDEADVTAMLTPGKLTRVGRAVLATGGAVSNTGLALHRLGLPVRLAGKIGDDLFGRAILELLRSQGPMLADGMIVREGEQSSYTVVLNPAGVDRIFLHCPGANDTFGAEDVPSGTLAGARLFHFGYPPLMRRMYADEGGELRTLFRRVKEHGLTTSLDMALPDPGSEAGRVDWVRACERVLPFVDVFLPSIDEILFMLERTWWERIHRKASPGHPRTGLDGGVLAEVSERLIRMGAAIVVFKLGDQGLYMRTTSELSRILAMGQGTPRDAAVWCGRELLAPCFAVRVRGTTGAGDCTIAGMLAGLLFGLAPESAMTSAVGVGACSVEETDATSGVRPWSDVQARIATGWSRCKMDLQLDGWRWDETADIWRGPHDTGRLLGDEVRILPDRGDDPTIC